MSLEAFGDEGNIAPEGYVSEETFDEMVADKDAEIERLSALLNTPLFEDFTAAVKLEAAHQIERWGTAHDRAKEPQDWYWLLGYLSGKALKAQIDGDREKALHHTISSAAVLLNWHAAILGTDNRMQPGSSDIQQAVEVAFGPGAASSLERTK